MRLLPFLLAPALVSYPLPGEAQAPMPLRPSDWKAFAAFLESRARVDEFSGVVRVEHAGKAPFVAVHGMAHRGYGLPIQADTRFNLGSLNKMWTAVAIGRLVEHGRLRLEDPLVRHLPEHHVRKGWEKITLLHLLTHTSGFGSYFTPEFQARRERIRALKDYFPLFQDTPLSFEPGGRFEYSNVGYLLLGAVIERVAGEDYFVHIQREVLDRAGMKDSGFFEADQDVPRMAMGYTRAWGEGPGPMPGPQRNNSLLQVVKGSPAGGAYSTAADMARFGRALLEGKLLKTETWRTLTEPRQILMERPGVRIQYGCGFGVETWNGVPRVGHTGGFPGTAGEFWIYPGDGTVAVLLANDDPSSLAPVAKRLREVMATPASAPPGPGRG